jgi:O-antigen/teichoic acid export membrane protein
VLSVVSGVLVARSLGPEDRGYLAFLVVVSGVCGLLGSLGLPTAATYYIAQSPSTARRIASSLAAPGMIQAAFAVVLQAGIVVAIVANEPERAKVAAAISLIIVPGILALFYGLAILQGQQRFTAFNVLRILPTSCYVVGVLLVFALDAADLVRVMAIWACANFFGGFLALAIACRGLEASSSDEPTPARSELSRFGLKSLAGSLSPVDSFRLDQAVVGLFLAPISLGYYVAAQAFTGLPRVAAASVGLVAYPRVAAEHDRAGARRTMWRYFFLGTALTALAAGVLSVETGRLVNFFFGSDFEPAASISRWLLLASVFMGARRVLTDGANGLGLPGAGTIAELSSWVLLVPAIAILLPTMGVDGVAIALVIAWAASLLILLVLVKVAETRPALTGEGIARGAFGALRRRTGRWAVVGAAIASGVATATLPPMDAVLVIVALTAGLFVAFTRSAARDQIRSSAAVLARTLPGSAEEERPEAADDAEFRLGRRLYYVGLFLIGVLVYRAGGRINFSDLIFLLATLFAGAEYVLLRRRVPILVPFLLLLGMAVFSVGGLLSSFGAALPTHSVGVVVRLIFLTVAWFWLGTVVLTSRAHLMRAVTLWVASAAVGGAAAAIQLAAGNAIPGAAPMVFGRSTGLTTQPNELGGLAAVALVPALMLASRRHLSPALRTLTYSFVLLVGIGLILSGSVGAMVAAVAAVFVWFAFQRSSVESILVMGAIAISAIGLVTVQAMRGAPTPLDRLSRVTSASGAAGTGSGSLDSRIATYRAAAKAIESDPFVGVGLDLVSVTRPFHVVSYEYDVHNLILGTWYKAGLIGLAGMLTVLFAIFKSGWTAIMRATSDEERMLANALLASFVAFVAFSMSEPALYARYGWISSALVIALRAVQVRRAGATVTATVREGRSRAGALVPIPASP